MKKIAKGLVALALLLVLVLSMAPGANASVIVKNPGETATITIEYDSIWGIEGTIEFSNPSIISKVEYDTSASGMTGMVENGKIFLYANDPAGATGKIMIHVTLSSRATEGASTDVEIRYNVTDAEGMTTGETLVIHETVMVWEDTEVPPPVLPPVEDPLDLSTLVAQLKKAQQLTGSDYTKESWNAVEQAVTAGLDAMCTGSQAKVDEAAANLRNAMVSLQPIRYEDLEAALESLPIQDIYPVIAPQWERFAAAVSNANAVLHSGSQTAVDMAIAELEESKEALLQAIDDLCGVEVVEIVVEKVVEKVITETLTETIYEEREVDSCTERLHIWFWVAIIATLVVYAVLMTLLIIFLVRKRRARRDDTPLVEYDIEDDGAPMT